jgi:membrane protease YdiL (CAAX protease family)
VPAAGVPGLATGRVPVAFTIFSGLITPAALLGWFFLFDPDVSDLTALVAGRSLPLVIIGGILFSVATAVFEEGLWRGVAFPALKPHFGVHGAVVLQAVSFGIAHTHGFPRGLVGATLAGSWAVLLGYLRLVSGGLLAPILAHVVADSTIAIIVIVLAQVQGS